VTGRVKHKKLLLVLMLAFISISMMTKWIGIVVGDDSIIEIYWKITCRKEAIKWKY
jgi:hypothetical protein